MESVKCTKCDATNKASLKYCSKCGYELPKAQEIGSVTQTHDDNQGTDKKKKLIASMVGTAAFAIAFTLAQQVFFKASSFDKAMMQAASELNKTCPIIVDQHTQFDNAIALPDNVFQYNYTLINIIKYNLNKTTV